MSNFKKIRSLVPNLCQFYARRIFAIRNVSWISSTLKRLRLRANGSVAFALSQSGLRPYGNPLSENSEWHIDSAAVREPRFSGPETAENCFILNNFPATALVSTNAFDFTVFFQLANIFFNSSLCNTNFFSKFTNGDLRIFGD